jgi:hypothetical protein
MTNRIDRTVIQARHPTARVPTPAKVIRCAQLRPHISTMRYPTLALALVASLPTALSFLETSPLIAWSSHR